MSTSRHLTVTAKPQATLVAQLLATHMGLPQTRTLRRAGAAHADAAYRQAEDLTPSYRASRDRRV